MQTKFFLALLAGLSAVSTVVGMNQLDQGDYKKYSLLLSYLPKGKPLYILTTREVLKKARRKPENSTKYSDHFFLHEPKAGYSTNKKIDILFGNYGVSTDLERRITIKKLAKRLGGFKHPLSISFHDRPIFIGEVFYLRTQHLKFFKGANCHLSNIDIKVLPQLAR